MIKAEEDRPFKVMLPPEQGEPVVVITPPVKAWRQLPAVKSESAKWLTVVVPAAETLRKLAPVVEATTKMGKAWVVVEATTSKLAPAGVEELMVKLLAVLSQRKLEEEEVVVGAV